MAEKILSDREVSTLSIEERIKYYSELRDYCSSISSQKRGDFLKKTIEAQLAKKRNFFYDIEGYENITREKVLFVSNHTSQRDLFIMMEAFKELGISASMLVNVDGMGKVAKTILYSYGTVNVDREDIKSIEKGQIAFIGELLGGNSGFLFGECTLNLHPYKKMLSLQPKVIQTAAIAKVPIVPVIIEYLEVPGLVESEQDLYQKCIIKFCKPILVSEKNEIGLSGETLENTMAFERGSILGQYGSNRDSLTAIEPKIYLNHTYLKKYGLSILPYDSIHEKCILNRMGFKIINEHKSDEYGRLVPGTINKEMGKRYVYLPKR